jgi:hypothetical protein
MFRSPKIRWLTACLLALAGCAPPEAVREFTAVAKDAAIQFPPLVKDLAESCIRRQLASRPAGEIADVDEQARSACKSLSDLEPQLLATLRVLTNYLNALNELASDEVVTYDKQIDSLSSNMQSVGAFQEAHVKAAGGLAKFLANAATSGYQRKKLAEDLKAADVHVGVLCDGLGKIIREDYSRVLENEESALRSRYRDAIQADPAKNAAVALVLQEYWRRDLQTLNQKRAAARDFEEILVKIRDGHKVLAAQASHWNTSEVIRTIAPYTGSIQSLVGDYRKAF